MAEDHAVGPPARLDGRWLTLDNRRMAMVEDFRRQKITGRQFVIDQHGVMRYADAPPASPTISGSNPAAFARREFLWPPPAERFV